MSEFERLETVTTKQLLDAIATMTPEEKEATRCVECRFYYGAHVLSCPLMTVGYMRELLRASHAREMRNTEAWRRQREKVAFWQAKFATLRHENNKLRRRLYGTATAEPAPVLPTPDELPRNFPWKEGEK